MGREAKATKPVLADRVTELERVVGLLAQFHNSLVGTKYGGTSSLIRRLKFVLFGH